MSLFEKKDFISHSNIELDWKIDCDFLTDKDIETLAFIIQKDFKFKKVIGVPTGGLRLAAALQKYEDVNEYNYLIVDDVLTTGKSMEEERKRIYNFNTTAFGVVIFARGNCPHWVTSIFKFDMVRR